MSSMSSYEKGRQAYCRQQKQKLNKFKVCTGWTQEWVSPENLLRNIRLDVRDVVRGPFISPKLLRTQPYVDSLYPDRNENNARRGIPDTWREYLACRGYCGATEARVQQKNLISSYVRSLATDRLWNDLGLPFVQGIPDPWKNSCCRLQVRKRPRRQHAFKKNIIVQTVNNYDADDEAETQCSIAKQFCSTKQHSDRMKDVPCTVQQESNLLPQDERTVQTDEPTLKYITKVKQNKIDQVIGIHNPKLLISSRKNISTTAKRDKKILKESIRNGPVTSKKESLVPDEKKPQKKVINPSAMKLTVERRVQTDAIEKANKGVSTVQTQMLQNFMCCSCKLQDRIGSNIQHFPNYASPLNEVEVSQRGICTNCEDVYRKNKTRRGDLATDINASELIPKNCYRRPNVAVCGKIYKRTKLKFRGCVQKTKQQFENCNCPTRMEGVSLSGDLDLKLVCCRCDCPYLTITSPDPIDRKTGRSDRPSGRMQKDRHIGPRERRRISKCTVTRKHGNNCNDSENRCKTRDENKASVPKRNLERPLHTAAGKQSEASKNVNKCPKSDGTSSIQ